MCTRQLSFKKRTQCPGGSSGQGLCSLQLEWFWYWLCSLSGCVGDSGNVPGLLLLAGGLFLTTHVAAIKRRKRALFQRAALPPLTDSVEQMKLGMDSFSPRRVEQKSRGERSLMSPPLKPDISYYFYVLQRIKRTYYHLEMIAPFMWWKKEV